MVVLLERSILFFLSRNLSENTKTMCTDLYYSLCIQKGGMIFKFWVRPTNSNFHSHCSRHISLRQFSTSRVEPINQEYLGQMKPAFKCLQSCKQKFSRFFGLQVVFTSSPTAMTSFCKEPSLLTKECQNLLLLEREYWIKSK